LAVTIGYTTGTPNGWDLTPSILRNCAFAQHFGISCISYIDICTYHNFPLTTLDSVLKRLRLKKFLLVGLICHPLVMPVLVSILTTTTTLWSNASGSSLGLLKWSSIPSI